MSVQPLLRGALFLILLACGSALRPVSAATQAKDLYLAHCSVCHQAGAQGVTGVYPRLLGRANALAATPAGRKLLVATVLFGMAGKLEQDSQTIVGVMAPFAQLGDTDVAAVLNYVLMLGRPRTRPFTAAEVRTVRIAPSLTSTQVNALAREQAASTAAH